MINIEKKYLEFIRSILKKYIPNDEVWLFGSRVTKKIKPYSDIDLAIISKNEISAEIMCKLSLKFSESDLPYKIDLVDWSALDDEFKVIIKKKHEVLQTGKVE